jgi:DNA-binding CsgD family transcriptional regulator
MFTKSEIVAGLLGVPVENETAEQLTERLVHKLDLLLGVFFESETVEHLAQRLVHEVDMFPGQAIGAFFFSVTAKSELKYLGGFGSSSLSDLEDISIWDGHPLAQAIRSGKHITNVSNKDLPEDLVCVPLVKGKIPNGVLVFQYPVLPNTKHVNEDLIWSTISILGGYFLGLQGLAKGRGTLLSKDAPHILEDLSTRQLEILRLIGDGLNNAEIAHAVLVSESTVRQDTIKIYRILGVANRHEAMTKGRALGLIASPQKPAGTIASAGAQIASPAVGVLVADPLLAGAVAITDL